jgi:YD repeat-containing protein
VTQAVLEDESSGYFLVPAGELPSRWRAVEEPEGNSVWGKGVTSNSDPDATTPDDIKKDPCHKSRGMAAYNVHLMVVSLNIEDTPVGYRPPVGPAIDFSVTYNQRDANQPATFAYSNLGQKWTFNWLAYIRDNPDNPAANVYYYVEGGGSLVFTGYDEVTQSFASQVREQTKLVRTSGNSYEMRFPDGSKKVFGQSDGATGTARRVFLTRIYDPYGNFVALTYDSNLRLVALTDAIGQVTTISYDHPSDIYKITKVTDPFGRFAAFSYTSNLLADITDTLGLHSQFTYSTNSFISAMTTPYGRTTFTMGELGRTRWLEATDPEGETERIEFSESESVGIRNAELASVVPKGLFTRNWVLYARNTYYWNKKAYAEARNDYTRARIYHWLHSSDYSSSIGVLESEKMPLENRVWYNYAGQPQNHEGATVPGSIDRPSVIGRVLEDGTTQLYQYGYNALGNVINTVDPLGRTFTSLYDANGVDLLEVRQTRGANHERLARFTYNSQHLPLTAVDAAGQTSTFTYNARGQLLTSTNPQGKVRTFSYDSNGYVVAFDDALPGTNDQVRLAYDSFGRVHSITNSDGYHLVFDYDVMDRLTNVVYPDGTFTAVTYDRLDPETSRDRLGRITRYAHNSLRKLVKIEDPLKRTTFFNWCGCGDLESIIDPLGRMTSWRRDIQSRIVAKRYADGSQILYNFENSTSRLQSQRDEKGQLTAYSYNPDDTIRQIAYPNALVPTASVTFAYDPDYPRVLSMQDGNGTTAYSYYPVLSLPSMGAGRLAAIDGPLPNDTILMQYDALGRITNQSINGVSGAIRFDPLGRLEAVATALGVFTNGYVLRTFLAS